MRRLVMENLEHRNLLSADVLDTAAIWTYRDAPVFGGITGVEFHTPEENGTSLLMVTRPMHDPTLNDLFPEATFRSPCIMQRVRTGPNRWESFGVGYGRTAAPGEMVYILVGGRTETILEDGMTMHIDGYGMVYSGREDLDHPAFGALHDQDTDPRDAWPDANEEPLATFEFEKMAYRLPSLPAQPPIG
jgi:hypothetical protein